MISFYAEHKMVLMGEEPMGEYKKIILLAIFFKRLKGLTAFDGYGFLKYVDGQNIEECQNNVLAFLCSSNLIIF